ncbi:DUF1887 family CARF protein [Nitrosomonas sp.]|uniref:Card1-like endonuclease domain-containing protein n=1 Tax=Nitrosomonas sp. TaxID=42353 RepID=UPI0025FB6DE6|nr:DUF1887 family CARF protein [Nitrosomonas sp.]MCC6916529.1 DUF1887 family protein [Nitrosomonas sp.]
MTVHVCLVSAQAAPNLLPALDPELKPKEVVLLVSQKMRAAADALSMVFKELGIRTDLIPLEDEHSSRVIEETLLQIASEREGEEILLNLTGGTKLMALVAQQTVAQEENWRSFYVDVDTDVVVWLDKTPGKKLAEQLRLRHYLKSYGFDLSDSPERPQITHEQRNLMQTLITQIGSLEKPLTQLNWLTQQAEDKKQLKITMDTQQADSRSLEALLRHFAEAGFLQVNGNTISYADETARNFVKGGWLELYTYSCVVDVTGETGIRDKAAGLEVMSKEGVKNEMDIAMMVRNRLFVIECKTARMDKPEAPKANDTLFKLSEICRRVGGLGTKGMLASYRPVADSERKLARTLNIELVCGQDLRNLRDGIRAWISAKNQN